MQISPIVILNDITNSAVNFQTIASIRRHGSDDQGLTLVVAGEYQVFTYEDYETCQADYEALISITGAANVVDTAKKIAELKAQALAAQQGIVHAAPTPVNASNNGGLRLTE